MRFTETILKGAFIIELEPRIDERGMFARAFCKREFQEHGLKAEIVQGNFSQNNKKGTLRGMHYQLAPFAEVKIIRCVRGKVRDVIIDIRPHSPTFLRWHAVDLDAEIGNTLYVPEGFAHGYQSLVDDTEVMYLVTQYYAPDYERGIRWNDPLFRIEWPIPNPILSPRDASHPDFQIG